MPDKLTMNTSDSDSRLVSGLWHWKRIEHPNWLGEVTVTSVKAKLPDVKGLETMVIVTGDAADGTPVVGFHSAIGLLEALAGAASRISSGHMKWKVDEYRTNGRT